VPPMPDQPPPRPPAPGLAELFGMIGTNNPITMMTKSVEQFRTGVAGFIDVVQTFRQTMDNLNAMTERMNRLLDDMEGPIRTVVPEITKSADSAARMIALLRGPVERVAPGLDQLAELLSNPIVVDLPRRLSETLDVVSSIPRALSPLGQVAELAGGLFGNARGIPGLTMSSRPATPAAEDPDDEEPEPVPGPPPKKKSAAKKTTAKKTTAKKTTAKKTTAKKTTAKKAAKRPEMR
jgi:hypothetical protein